MKHVVNIITVYCYCYCYLESICIIKLTKV